MCFFQDFSLLCNVMPQSWCATLLQAVQALPCSKSASQIDIGVWRRMSARTQLSSYHREHPTEVLHVLQLCTPFFAFCKEYFQRTLGKEAQKVVQQVETLMQGMCGVYDMPFTTIAIMHDYPENVRALHTHPTNNHLVPQALLPLWFTESALVIEEDDDRTLTKHNMGCGDVAFFNAHALKHAISAGEYHGLSMAFFVDNASLP